MKHYKKIMIYTVLIAVLLQCLCGCGLLDSLTKTRVQWRDEAVGRAAAEALGKRSGAAVFFDELDQITHLVISSDSVVDLTDLGGLVSLIGVDVSQAKVNDYSPLLYCTNLTELYVGNADYAANIEMLTQLQEMMTKTDIDVDANYYAMIPVQFENAVMEEVVRDKLSIPQGELTCADTRHVEELSFENMENFDLSDLKYLSGLRELTLTNCGVTDIEPILQLSDLQYLNLEDNAVTDLSGIEALSYLQVLSVSGNPIDDFSPLCQLENLFALSMQRCAPQDLSFVAQMPALTNLYMVECGIEDVSFLAGCSDLTVLWLDDNKIADVTPLGKLTELTVLGLSANRVEDISALSGLTKLESLYLSANNITDISPLQDMQSLGCLHLIMNNVFDVSVIGELPNLTELSILSNPVLDYTPILESTQEWSKLDVDPGLAQQGAAAAQAIAANIQAQGLAGSSAVGAAHDAVIRTASYDHNAANAGELGFQVQSAYSALVRTQTVCVGYAEALTMILRQLGMEAYVVSGTAGGVEHAWTLLMIDGVAYYIDPTWDDPDEGSLIYREFLMVGQEKLDQTHDWDVELFLPNVAAN